MKLAMNDRMLKHPQQMFNSLEDSHLIRTFPFGNGPGMVHCLPSKAMI